MRVIVCVCAVAVAVDRQQHLSGLQACCRRSRRSRRDTLIVSDASTHTHASSNNNSSNNSNCARAGVMTRLGGTHESTQQWPTSSMCPPDTLHVHGFVIDKQSSKHRSQHKHQTDRGMRWSSIG